MLNQCPGLGIGTCQVSQITGMLTALTLSRNTRWCPSGHCQRAGVVGLQIQGPHRYCRMWSWCCLPCGISPTWPTRNTPIPSLDPNHHQFASWSPQLPFCPLRGQIIWQDWPIQPTFASWAPYANPSSKLAVTRDNPWPLLDPYLSLESRLLLTSGWWVFCFL